MRIVFESPSHWAFRRKRDETQGADMMISVIIPVLNESPTIASVIRFVQQSPLVSEVIVVDDGSLDDTPELARAAGARVITSTLMGKGASMEDGAWAASNEVLLFLDGDLSGLDPQLIEKMTSPILVDRADFVKAKFSRSAGRVTLLTAKPLLQTFFPELTWIDQPLGGIVAVRRSILRNLRMETDYGVDVGMLLDIAAMGAAIEQVDIGFVHHDNQPLHVLGDMAKQVVRVILQRSGTYGRLDLEQIREVEEVERHSQAELSMVFSQIGKPQRLALFDMDGTLIRGRFVVNLAQRVNKMRELDSLLDHPTLSAEERTHRIGRIFVGVSKQAFEETARSIPLMPGATDLVIALRRAGYQVGIVSDSFRVATEIVRRRIFADFSLAHLMRFRREIATGELTICPAMTHANGCKQHHICKMNVLYHLCEQLAISPEQVLAVGDSANDLCMLRIAGISVAFQPKSADLEAVAKYRVDGSLAEINRFPMETNRDTNPHADRLNKSELSP